MEKNEKILIKCYFSIYCTICYLRPKKLGKCDDEHLSSDLPEKLFRKFSLLEMSKS